MKTKEEFLNDKALVAKFKTFVKYAVAMETEENGTEDGTNNSVRGFSEGINKRRAKRIEFLNKNINFTANGTVMVNALFCNKDHMKDGKVLPTASRVFCEITVTSEDGNQSIKINDNFDEMNEDFSVKGKTLLNEDGTAVPVSITGIVKGKYQIPE